MRGFAGNRKPIFFVAVVVVVHFREDPSVLFPHPIRSIDKGRERKRASLSLTGQRNFSKRRLLLLYSRKRFDEASPLYLSLSFFSRTGEKALALPFLGVRKRRISPVLSGGRRVGRWRRSARRRNWLSHRRVITGYYGVLAGRAATTDNHSSPRRGEKRDRPARESRFSTLRSSRRIPGTNATRGKPNEWQYLARRVVGGA